MAEAILFNVATSIITKLGSPALQQAKKWWDVNDELEKLKTTVQTIYAVLLDAEEQYSQSHQIKVWVDSLKQAFYDADDLLDEFSTKALQEQVLTGNKMVKEVRLFFSSSNPFSYSLKMSHNIKKIRSKLDGIAENRKFHLDERREKTCVMADQEREQTHSSLPEVVIGREHDKERIIEFLLSSNYGKNVSIISIVGIGGVGKTMLSQLVFDDETVKSNFELKLWVCISGNFDVKAIVEKILESINGEKPTGNCEINTLKNMLHEKINGKKYLLVLDDVWNEDYDKWDRLKDLLVKAASGNKIIVTTRLKNVAKRIRSDSIYELQGLPETESWSLFKNMTFKEGQLPSPEYELVGKEIVAKCYGVPLAIRVIGRLLYSKNTISEWQSFKDTEFLNVHNEVASILSTLKLSYNHLPSHLKYCFAYCRLFPKDFIFDVRFLVHHWVAQGFIKSLDNSKQDLEDIGLEYFKELLWRSFFQKVKEDSLGNIETCKMHDLIYDLAVLVAGEEIAILNSNICVNKVIRHLSFELRDSSCKQLAHVLASARKVRTVLICNMLGQQKIKEEELHAIFSNLRRLRALNLSNLRIKRVSPSVDKLKHIRYLDLSSNKGLEFLPNSICKLQNLQMLGLIDCERLKQLPKHFKMLVNLRQLYIEGCVSLTHMPRGLGQLTSLRNLPMFIVAKDNGISKQSGGLDELHDLNNLRESLRICNLRYVKNAASEFEAANLKEKHHLKALLLAWKMGLPYDNSDSNANEVDNDNEEISLEELRPHLNLKWLILCGCGRLKFPSWVSCLTNLVELEVVNCKKCQCFPPLAQFPFLKTLTMDNLTDLEYIESDNQMSRSVLFFPSLEKLWLLNCPNLKGWWRPELLQFHCLVYLDIQSCPNLTSMPLIPSVETLVLKNVKFPSWVSSLTNLVELTIVNCKKCQRFPSFDQFPFLKRLVIDNMTDLEYIESENQMSGSELFFPALEKLSLSNCPNLKGWLRPELLQFHCLVYLDIQSCPNLTSMPLIPSVETLSLTDVSIKSLEDILKMKISLSQSTSSSSLSAGVSQLKTLAIVDCQTITSLLRAIRHLTSLKELIIRDCHELDFLDDDDDENKSGIMQWECLRSLEEIEFENIPKLVSLPKGLQRVPTLRKLFIISCLNLMCLPKWMPNLTALQVLRIDECPQLSERCNSNMGVDWPKIAHIPDIYIEDRWIQDNGSYVL